MRRSFLFIGILVAASGITWAFQTSNSKPPEKRYSVTLPLQNWVQITNELEYIKGQLKQTDLPAKQVAFMSDSLLSPLQTTIGTQVNAQLQLEQKKDSTNHKK
jgi:hypothetical protein